MLGIVDGHSIHLNQVFTGIAASDIVLGRHGIGGGHTGRELNQFEDILVELGDFGQDNGIHLQAGDIHVFDDT